MPAGTPITLTQTIVLGSGATIESTVRLRVAHAGAVSGVVVQPDRDGLPSPNPVTGATVSVNSSAGDYSCVTGSDGAFSIAGFASNSVIRLSASYGFATATAVAVAASQGNFELNVYLPLVAHHFLQSARLMSESILAFTRFCVEGIEANRDVMRRNLDRSLMAVTALNPSIGYENAARAARLAWERGCTLREACAELGLLSGEDFDRLVRPETMI